MSIQIPLAPVALLLQRAHAQGRRMRLSNEHPSSRPRRHEVANAHANLIGVVNAWPTLPATRSEGHITSTSYPDLDWEASMTFNETWASAQLRTGCLRENRGAALLRTCDQDASDNLLA
jgi:hypothetical protein